MTLYPRTATGPGERLPNGAILIAQRKTERRHKDGNEFVVLAVNEGSYQPYITWFRFVGVQRLANGEEGPLDYCVSGHYFKDIEEAIHDFANRA